MSSYKAAHLRNPGYVLLDIQTATVPVSAYVGSLKSLRDPTASPKPQAAWTQAGLHACWCREQVCRGSDVTFGGRSALAEPASSDRQQGAAYKVSPALFITDSLLGVGC